MSYSLGVLPNNMEPFSKEVEEKFNKRDKSSSKCIDQILSSETSFESPISFKIPKLGLSSSSTLKPNSSINVYTKKLNLASTKQIQTKEGLKFNCSSEENLELLLNNCIKNGMNFEETFEILEKNSLIQVSPKQSFLNEEKDQQSQKSQESSDSE